jgi:hypothetical protein
MEEAVSSETSVRIYVTTGRYIQEYHLNIRLREILRSPTFITVLAKARAFIGGHF